MDLPIQDENWTQNLRDYGEHRKEMWNDDHEPCGTWEWFYGVEKTGRKAKLVFNDTYPWYMTCWYENGVMRERSRYKDGSPILETWKIWSEHGELVLGEKKESMWNPLYVGYVSFAIAYMVTTIFNW